MATKNKYYNIYQNMNCKEHITKEIDDNIQYLSCQLIMTKIKGYGVDAHKT